MKIGMYHILITGVTAAPARRPQHCAPECHRLPCPSWPTSSFGAWRLKQLGLAADTIPHRKLAVGTLTVALRRALDDAMRSRTHDMAARLRSEDGLASAVGAIEEAVSVS
jgi:hypothetical protein